MAYASFDIADRPATPLTGETHAYEIAQQAQPALALPEAVPVRHLLVALDGSAYAERALPYAAAFAHSATLEMTVAHVRAPTPSPFAGRLVNALQHPLQHPQRAHDCHISESKADIADVAVYMQWIQQALCRLSGGVSTHVELVDAPSAAFGLRELQAQHAHSITVLASHARQGAERLLLGSVADELVRHGTRPVLVIPPGVEATHEGSYEQVPSLTRVLVPLDGSPLSERALAVVAGWLSGVDLCERCRYEVTLLTVAESQASLDTAGDYVQSMRDALAAALPDVPVRAQAFVGSPPGLIVAAAGEGLPHHALGQRGADLVVMATHGRGRLGSRLYGSVASYVVPHVGIPVLLVTTSHAPDTR